MKKVISGIAIFAIGFVSGILGTKLYMKKQNEKIEDEVEIESEKMPGGENPENNSMTDEEFEEEVEIESEKMPGKEIPENNSMTDEEFEEYYRRLQDEYMRRIINEGYEVNEKTTVISESGDIMYDSDRPDPPVCRYDEEGYEMEEYTVMADRPYNIPPEEYEVYCEADGTWNSEEYTYYADGYVTDSQGLPVSPEDVIRCIGTEFPNWFGTYEDDQIWIRNDELRMDFSVVRDLDNFVDIADARLKRLAGIR